jgi:hypothetical protein
MNKITFLAGPFRNFVRFAASIIAQPSCFQVSGVSGRLTGNGGAGDCAKTLKTRLARTSDEKLNLENRFISFINKNGVKPFEFNTNFAEYPICCLS